MLEYNVQEPWLRQPCDTDLSWSLFQLFLSLPLPRRISDVLRLARPMGVTAAQLQALASEDVWYARAHAWDMHLDELRRKTIEEVTKEDARQRAERHAKLARKVQRMGESEIDRLMAVSEKSDIVGLITPRDAYRAALLGIRSERESLGDFVDKVEDGFDLSSLTLEDLRAIKRIQDKINPQR